MQNLLMQRLSIGLLLFLCTTLTAQAQTDLDLTQAQVERVGNTGPVSVVIEGQGFDDSTTFELVLPGGSRHVASQQLVLSWTKAIATFELSGAATGAATLEAKQGAITKTLSNAFSVENDLEGDLKFHLEAPTRILPGGTTLIQVQYRNEGFSDVEIPLFLLTVEDATSIVSKIGGKNLGTSVSILGLPQDPLWTALRPGESVTQDFYVQVSVETTATLIHVNPSDSNFASIPIDYSSIGSSPAATDYINALKTDNGDTLGQLHEKTLLKVRDLVKRDAHKSYDSVQVLDGQWKLSRPEPIITGFRSNLESRPKAERPQTVPHGSLSTPPTSSDGVPRLWVVIITDEDYQFRDDAKDLFKPEFQDKYYVNAWAGNNLPGTQVDGARVYDLFNLTYGVPSSQITWLNDAKGNEYTISPSDVDSAIRGLSSKADGDDKLVVYYSGHGMGRANNKTNQSINEYKYDPGTWLLNSGVFTADDLSSAIDSVDVGSTYVISDSCYSGAIIDDLSCTNTAAFASTSDEQVAVEGHFLGGYFTDIVVSELEDGKELFAACLRANTELGGFFDENETFFESQMPSTNSSTSDWDYGGFSVDVFSPFDNIVNTQASLSGTANNHLTPSSLKPGLGTRERSILLYAPAAGATYTPGGLAVCPWAKMFYVSDNTNGQIRLINTYEPEHRELLLLGGLAQTGDIDLGYRGRSLVYTDDNRVKQFFFGFTAHIADNTGTALGGAQVVVQSERGEFATRADGAGYVTVLNLLTPDMVYRNIGLTVTYAGKQDMFTFQLNPSCHTFRKLVFVGDGKTRQPVPPKEPSPPVDAPFGAPSLYTPVTTTTPPIDEPLPPYRLTVEGSGTHLIPPVLIEEEGTPTSGGSADLIISIVTPAHESITDRLHEVLTGTIEGGTVTQATVEVNGAGTTIPVSRGTFSSLIDLTAGSNTIVVRATSTSGKNGESDPSLVTLDESFDNSSGSIVGQVSDNTTGSGIAGKVVTEKNSGQTTSTNAQGYYTLNGVPAGEAEIQVEQ